MRMKYGCKGYELSYLLIQFFILNTRTWTQFVQSLRLARICVDDIYIYTRNLTRAIPRVILFCIKNNKTNKNLKNLDFFTKLYPKNLDLAATPDLRVIFIILIIKLNLHDPSLGEPGCNTGPKNIGCGSRYKVVS